MCALAFTVDSLQAPRQSVIDDCSLPWVVVRLGCRAEYWPRPVPPVNGGDAAEAEDPTLDEYLHLFALNRGILMAPFHNVALMAPDTTAADVGRPSWGWGGGGGRRRRRDRAARPVAL
jgi:glutamate-1-semialdehyde 2,1-aminomutase